MYHRSPNMPSTLFLIIAQNRTDDNIRVRSIAMRNIFKVAGSSELEAVRCR